MRRIIIFTLLLAFFMPVAAFATYGDTTTAVGQLYYGDGEKAKNAGFDFPEGLSFGPSGNMFIADTYNHVIRKINTNNIVSTIVGTGGYGDGTGDANFAELAEPSDVDSDGNNVIIADTANGKIKKLSNGQVYTLVEGLDEPRGVAIDGNTVYFTETGTDSLKKVSINGGDVTTITSSLHGPKKLDIYGNYAYVADSENYNLVKVKLDGGHTTIIAGMSKAGNRTGKCSRTKFRNLWGVAVKDKDTIYVSDGTGNIMDDSTSGRGTGFAIKIDLSDGCNTEVFASDEDMVSLNFPNGMDIKGNYLYVASTGIGVIAKYDLATALYEQFAGDSRFGSKGGVNALLGRPKTMAQHPKKKNKLYFTDNNKIRLYKTKKGSVNFVAGNVVDNYAADDDKMYFGKKARFSDPRGLAFSKKGKWLYVADRNNNRIRKVNTRTRKVGYLTGAGETNVIGGQDNGYKEGNACANQFNTGKKNCAYFNRPTGLVKDPKKKILYVADTDNHVIRKVYIKTGRTKLVAGNPTNAGFTDGIKKKAKFDTPYGLSISKSGKVLYVADRNNHAIRKVRIRDGKTTTLAGTGDNGYQDGLFENAQFSYPTAVDYKDRNLYVSEVGSQMIRVMDLETDVVKLVSGSGYKGFRNGDKDDAKYYNPGGMVARKNNLYIADELNDLIRKVTIRGEAPYTDPAPTVASMSPQSLKYSDYPSGTAMVNVYGAEFRHGVKAYLGGYELTTYVQSDSSLAVEVPIGEMAAGYYELKVMNNDGQEYKLQRAFSAQEYSGNIPVIDYWTN